MKYNILITVIALLAIQPAKAAVVQTVGAGSAVISIDASADFENVSALFDNPYLEGGLSFSRTGLSFDNNTCGFAGCAGHSGFTGFTGNYMYGVGNGFFTISTLGAATMTGLEFVVGTGFFFSDANISWEAYLDGNLVGSGTALASVVGQVIGFSDASGFDELRYTDDFSRFNLDAPAFDSVRAQLSPSQVPVPAAIWLFGSGLMSLWASRRKRNFV